MNKILRGTFSMIKRNYDNNKKNDEKETQKKFL